MTHLFVLSHGLWGNAQHMNMVKDEITKSVPSATVLNITSNEGNHSYDGIDVCGNRVVAELLAFIGASLNSTKFEKISFVGYSLGGLILRYAIGKLYQSGFFENIKPIFYVSLACPHLGTHKPHFTGELFNSLQDIYLVRVGSQFSVRKRDDSGDSRPLLVVMSDPKLSFWKGLQLFQSRILFANTHNDRSVRWCTSSIEPSNPFRKFEKRVINEEYYPSIVEATQIPIKEKPLQITDLPATTGKFLVTIIIIPVFLIIATTALGIQSIRARMRLATHTEIRHIDEHPYNESEPEDQISNNDEPVILDKEEAGFRSYMIERLNRLGWTKINLYINAFNAHAAIVQRSGVLGEGKDVIKYLGTLLQKQI